jgi:thioredoxin 1
MSDDGVTVKVSDDTFEQEVRKSSAPVLVDFWAEWCGPCRAVAPTLDALAAQYKGRLKVAKMNVDDNPQTPREFNVRAIPTLLLFDQGEVKATLIGAQSKAQLEAAISEHVVR